MAGAEKRKHPRVEVGIMMDIYTRGRFTKLGPGYIKNLSLGGMCIETPADFVVGIPLNLRIALTKSSPFDILGKVVWKQEYPPRFVYGIKFVEMDFGVKHKINKYILARLAKEPRN